MASTLITYSAQKLHIQCLRGNHFKLVINVKNADGSNYDFTEIDNSVTPTPTTETAYELRMRIFEAMPGQANNGQQPLYNSPDNVAWYNGDPQASLVSITDRLKPTVEDGKLTLEWDSPDNAPFTPWPGRYKYHIYTRSVNSITDGTYDSPIKTIWLFGDFIVKDNNMYAGAPQVGLSQTSG